MFKHYESFSCSEDVEECLMRLNLVYASSQWWNSKILQCDPVPNSRNSRKGPKCILGHSIGYSEKHESSCYCPANNINVSFSEWCACWHMEWQAGCARLQPLVSPRSPWYVEWDSSFLSHKIPVTVTPPVIGLCYILYALLSSSCPRSPLTISEVFPVSENLEEGCGLMDTSCATIQLWQGVVTLPSQLLSHTQKTYSCSLTGIEKFCQMNLSFYPPSFLHCPVTLQFFCSL